MLGLGVGVATHRSSAADLPAAMDMTRAIMPSRPEQGAGSPLVRASMKATWFGVRGGLGLALRLGLGLGLGSGRR